MSKRGKQFILFIFVFVVVQICFAGYALAEGFASMGVANMNMSAVSINIAPTDDNAGVTESLQLLFILSLITLAPFLLLMITSFTRIIISLHFMRSALGTQQMPPNQVMIGIALFLTLFIMSPIFTKVNDTAIKPYSDGLLSQDDAMTLAMEPMREFMFSQVETNDMLLFIRLSGESYETQEEIPNRVLIPAFMLGELTKGFKIGFIVYVPFLVIDMIVASVLMAMGMMMLPPAMISLPFKLLLFVMVDGWSLLIEGVVMTFR